MSNKHVTFSNPTAKISEYVSGDNDRYNNNIDENVNYVNQQSQLLNTKYNKLFSGNLENSDMIIV